MIDWGIGRYERTAEELAPASERVVAIARIEPGQRVLDIGCGAGNATLLAAQAGATVTSLDPSERLLGVARERLAAAGFDATLIRAQAEDLPFETGTFDIAVSVFGIVFAADPEPRKRFTWHDEEAVGALAKAHGATVRASDHELTITAPSPEEYLAASEASHPMSVAMRPVLERAGTAPAVRERALAVLREGNEDPTAFRVTSPYRLVRVSREEK